MKIFIFLSENGNDVVGYTLRPTTFHNNCHFRASKTAIIIIVIDSSSSIFGFNKVHQPIISLHSIIKS